MTLVKDLGMHPSFVRCYRLSWAPRIKHLESVDKLPDFKTIKRIVEEHGQPDPFKEQAAFFVHQNHLPDELLREWRSIENFHGTCEVIAFSKVVRLLQISSFRGLPTKQDMGNATPYIWSGFPVTLPVPDAEIDCAKAESFGVGELQDFLGELIVHAGRMIFLGLHGMEGEHSHRELRRTIELLTAGPAYLPGSSPIRH